MDPSDFRPSPRRELALQGPRPTPLKVSKESHTIKKPPVAPQARSNVRPAHAPPQPQPLPQSNPVIIYAVSPKTIYTKASNFMTLVQRLTGPDSTADTSVADLTLPSPASGGGALSPAARIATFEKSSPSTSGYNNFRPWQSSSIPTELYTDSVERDVVTVDNFHTEVGFTSGQNPGILSPLPSSLPPISPAFFSPNFDPGMLGFLTDLSPAIINNNNNSCGVTSGSSNMFNSNNNMGYWDGANLLQSPGNNLLMTPLMPSPGAWGEFFNQFPDL